MAQIHAAVVAAMRSHPCVTVRHDSTHTIEFEANPTVPSIQKFILALRDVNEPGVRVEQLDNYLCVHTDALNHERLWRFLAGAWDDSVQARYASGYGSGDG